MAGSRIDGGSAEVVCGPDEPDRHSSAGFDGVIDGHPEGHGRVSDLSDRIASRCPGQDTSCMAFINANFIPRRHPLDQAGLRANGLPKSYPHSAQVNGDRIKLPLRSEPSSSRGLADDSLGGYSDQAFWTLRPAS